jgi:hypothetical protein
VFDEYLEMTRCRFVLFPAARWSELEATLAARSVFIGAGGRFIARELRLRMALARGDLAPVDSALSDALEEVWASGEPQRIVPLAGVAALRAGVAGDAASVAAIARDVREQAIRLPIDVMMGGLDIARALRQVHETAELDRFAGVIRSSRRAVAPTPRDDIVQAAVDGLQVLAAGRPGDAVAALERSRDLEAAMEAPYELALAELDLAEALTAAGDAGGAGAARARAGAILVPLGCPDPSHNVGSPEPPN